VDGDGRGADAGFVGVPLVFFFELVFLFGEDATRVAELFDAVSGELGLDGCCVAGFFQNFGVVVGVHHVQVLPPGEDHGFFVGRNGGPHGFFAHGLDIVEAGDFAGGQFVFEREDARFFGRFRRLPGAKGALALLLDLLVFSLLVIVLLDFAFVALLAAVVLGFFFGFIGDHAVFADFHFKAHARVFVDELLAFDG